MEGGISTSSCKKTEKPKRSKEKSHSSQHSSIHTRSKILVKGKTFGGIEDISNSVKRTKSYKCSSRKSSLPSNMNINLRSPPVERLKQNLSNRSPKSVPDQSAENNTANNNFQMFSSIDPRVFANSRKSCKKNLKRESTEIISKNKHYADTGKSNNTNIFPSQNRITFPVRKTRYCDINRSFDKQLLSESKNGRPKSSKDKLVVDKTTSRNKPKYDKTCTGEKKCISNNKSSVKQKARLDSSNREKAIHKRTSSTKSTLIMETNAVVKVMDSSQDTCINNKSRGSQIIEKQNKKRTLSENKGFPEINTKKNKMETAQKTMFSNSKDNYWFNELDKLTKNEPCEKLKQVKTSKLSPNKKFRPLSQSAKKVKKSANSSNRLNMKRHVSVDSGLSTKKLKYMLESEPVIKANPNCVLNGENVFQNGHWCRTEKKIAHVKTMTDLNSDDDSSKGYSFSNSCSRFDQNLLQDSCDSNNTSDDDLPQFLPQANVLLYSPKTDDLVWVKYRKYPFWPAKISSFLLKKSAIKKVSINFLGIEHQKSLKMTYNNKSVLPYCHAKKDDFIAAGKTLMDEKEKQSFSVAVKEATELITKKASISLAKLITPTENRTLESYRSFNSFSTCTAPDSHPNFKIKQEPKHRSLSLDTKVTPKMLQKCERRKNMVRHRNTALITFIKTAETKKYLFSIYRGQVESELHRNYHSSVAEKNRLSEMKESFRYLEDDDQIQELFDTLYEYFNEITEGNNRYNVDYVVNVWFPEAVVFSLIKVRRMCKEKAWEVFQKPKKWSRIEEVVEHQQLVNSCPIESKLSQLRPPPMINRKTRPATKQPISE